MQHASWRFMYTTYIFKPGLKYHRVYDNKNIFENYWIWKTEAEYVFS